MKLTIEMEPLVEGRMLTYQCPKGCDWKHVAILPDGPVDVTINSDMSDAEIAEAIRSTRAKRDADLTGVTETRVLEHVLNHHLYTWVTKSADPSAGIDINSVPTICNAVQPGYGDGRYRCVLFKGHTSNHRDEDNDEWENYP